MHGRVRIAWRHLLTGMLAAAAAGHWAPSAAAAVYTVTSQQDGGSCSGTRCDSIRAALGVAGDGDAILVPAGDYPLTGTLTVTQGVAIVGAGAASTTLRAAGAFRVFLTQSFEQEAAITHLTISDGTADGDGGNVDNEGLLALDHVRVTGGSAADGGGVANSDGSLTITHSLLDGNTASASGGAILNSGVEVGGKLTVADSTLAGNAAATGGGVETSGRIGVVEVVGVTVARNTATYRFGGLYQGGQTGFTVVGSIVGDNTDSLGPSDCAGAVDDRGGNLDSAGDCGFRTTADPQLGPGLDDLGGETPVLALAPGSPAVGLAGSLCDPTDQRDVPRPQGNGCDAGAYELAAQPALSPGAGGGSSSFTFSSPGITTFECRLDGPGGPGAWVACTSPREYAGLPAGAYVFNVRVPGGDAAAQAFAVAAPAPARAPAPTPTPAPAPPPSPTATPVPSYHRTVVVRPTTGTVKVKLKGSHTYVPLSTAGAIPLGASIDARRGHVRLTAARTKSGRIQSATFYDGVFKVSQRGAFTELTLAGPPISCSSTAKAASAPTRRHTKRKHRTRKLWGSGSGSFRTRGHYSAATVRGTKWLVQDSCAGTLTRVVRGVVSVRDRVHHRTVIVRAGHRYLARRGR